MAVTIVSAIDQDAAHAHLVGEEYCDSNADSFSYSWFCERYKEWAGRLKPTRRQVHVAGEKLFVDYSAHT
jgi:transposase